MLLYGLKAKILSLTVGIIVLGFGAFVFLVIKEEEKSLLKERTKASVLMSEPILHTIYKDMLEERADMTRFLMEGLKTMKDVERVQIIRSNGIEEAFQDFKTLKAVEVEFGEIKPEWLIGHLNKPNNIAEGIWHPEFKKALALFNEGRKESIHYIEKEDTRSLFTYLVPIEFRQKCSSCHAQEEEARGVLMISTSLEGMHTLLDAGRNKWLMYGFAMVVVVVMLLGLLINIVIIRPVDRAAAMLKSIAEGKGDLTITLDITSSDEIGMLGKWFNKFVEGLKLMVKDIFSVSGEVSLASKRIEGFSRDMVTSVKAQIMASEDMSVSIREMDESIRTVTEDADALAISSKKVSASAQAMYSSAEDVQTNNEKLFLATTGTTSSINQIAATINEVASHVDNLFEKTEEVVSSINDIGTRISEIEDYSRLQAKLAQKVRSDAEDIGLLAVVKTREGIEKINEEVQGASSVINRLGEQSKEINKILILIHEFTDTTQLLSLNATILAAQAGEHGKGFAVVARQVKELASKTTESTREVALLVGQVQGEVAVAIDSMKRSSERVSDGLKLSRDAQEGFGKILEIAKHSFDMAKMIEGAANDQTKGVGHLSDAARMIREMISEIKRASDAQALSAKEMLKDTVEMREFMERVKLSTGEQLKETKHVSDALLKVTEKIRRVAEATNAQILLSKRIVDAMETVKKVAGNNAVLAAGLDKTVKETNELSEILRKTVANFKT
ncbi:MAG: methyl-accepting chemotaxis protein [Deltaproteobacteria bacterium]|nr:methyl-accepting chemotaxis protein [Deltaproteobacteria bacterium]